MLIAADVGGTKTHLSLFKDENVHEDPLHLVTYSSPKYENFLLIIEDFLKECHEKIPHFHAQGACFAIAGPVKENRVKTTNLPWLVDAEEISKKTNLFPVYIINDLEACAYALEILPQEKFVNLYEGKGNKEGNRAIISPGTGLGEAGLFWDGKKHHPFSCEGGHTEFGPRNSLQVELSIYLQKIFGHPSYERILSGPGFLTLFEFFKTVMKREEPSWLQEECRLRDPAKVITENALNGRSSLCEEVLHLFVDILGAETGNLALKLMTYGGIYLGGGIPPKIATELKKSFFLKAFLDKGRLREALAEMPVSLILEEKSSLKGAAHFLQLKLNKAPY